ncbi:hypothetical protein Tco_1225180, partial [Tanacetum coccineum]
DVRVLVDGHNTSSFAANTGKKGLISRGKQPIGKVLTQAVRFGDGYQCAFGKLNAMISEMEAMGDQEEVYDSLMCLRDDKRAENHKIIA